MNIELAKQSDLNEILKLQYLAYQSEAKLLGNYDIPPLKQTIDDIRNEYENGIILKYISKENVIIGSVRAYFDKSTLYIGKLIVAPEFQGRGIGTKLLLFLEENYKVDRYELFTSSMSQKNIMLYTKLGYKIFKEEKISESLSFVYLEKLKN